MRNYHRWTEADDAILRARFAELIAAELAALIGVGIKQIYWRAHALGLRKTRDWVIERARLRSLQPGHGGSANWFKKGADPWNKGLSYTPGGRSGETRFRGGVRQGRAADLWHPVGTLRLNSYGYLERKVNDPVRDKPRRSGRGRIARTAQPSLSLGFSVGFAAARCTGARWKSARRRSLKRNRTATTARLSSSASGCQAVPSAAGDWRRL